MRRGGIRRRRASGFSGDGVDRADPVQGENAEGGEQTPALLGDWPVAYDDSAQRPSTITHRLPKPKTSMSTVLWLSTLATCDSVSTRGSTARRMP